MTTFATPLKIGGPNPGVPSLNTEAHVTFTRIVHVSGALHAQTITLPDNAFITDIRTVVTTNLPLTQGATLRIGDSSTATQYATFRSLVSASVYGGTLTEQIVSAKTVVVDVTASVAASAGDFTTGHVTVFITGGISA